MHLLKTSHIFANSAVFRPHDVDEAGDDEVIADDDVSDFKGEPENRPSDDFDDVEMDDTHYTDRALSALVTAICQWPRAAPPQS